MPDLTLLEHAVEQAREAVRRLTVNQNAMPRHGFHTRVRDAIDSLTAAAVAMGGQAATELAQAAEQEQHEHDWRPVALDPDASVASPQNEWCSGCGEIREREVGDE